jgi:hypothetical protein
VNRRVAAARPRLAVTIGIAVMATATLAFAADVVSRPSAQPAKSAAKPELLVVPDLSGQVFVFAKGMLEEAGFAWRVTGSVDGFAANRVVGQQPKPGTAVVDTGSPTVVLQLASNSAYATKGKPENESPYRGTPIELPAKAVPAKAAPAKTQAAGKPAAGPATAAAPAKAARPAAFAVPGAPAEPQNELALPQRAKQLAAWLDGHPAPTNANVRHWLYQHAWIVTGAKFGWWGGAQALEILVRADRKAEQLWGVGSRSRLEAERALREVRTRSR